MSGVYPGRWCRGVGLRTGRLLRSAARGSLAGAALMGLVAFIGEHCEFGATVDGLDATFLWPALMMFTYPAALVGAVAARAVGSRRAVDHLEQSR